MLRIEEYVIVAITGRHCNTFYQPLGAILLHTGVVLEPNFRFRFQQIFGSGSRYQKEPKIGTGNRGTVHVYELSLC